MGAKKLTKLEEKNAVDPSRVFLTLKMVAQNLGMSQKNLERMIRNDAHIASFISKRGEKRGMTLKAYNEYFDSTLE